MDIVLTLLPYIKVLAAFAVMLGGMRLKIGLAPSILLGGAFLGVVFGMGIMPLLETATLSLVQEKFLYLLSIVGLIMVLSDGLERSGQSKRLMEAMSGYLINPKMRLIFFPALIGLLPMPGGAIFSAPMVKTMGEKMAISAEDQATINYWFRHVWEMAWPLYPGIILTVALADIPISAFISRTWPGVVAVFFFGWLFLLRPVVPKIVAGVDAKDTGGRDFGKVRREGLPLLIAIVGAIGCESALASFSPQVPFELGVIVALLAAVATVMIQNGLGFDFLRQVLTKKTMWSMLMVIAAIFIFKDTMHAAGIVEEMAAAAGGGAALFAASVFLPFLVGMVAGVNVAFVGATFPLLLGLLRNLGMDSLVIPYLVIATFAGFTGVMISPIHICFVLTCNFFGADISSTWRRLVVPCCAFLAVGIAYFYLLTMTVN